MRATFRNFLVRFLASLRMRAEMSIPTRSVAECPTSWKRSPVPHPRSNTMLSDLGRTSLNAAFIFDSCSSTYCESYVSASLS